MNALLVLTLFSSIGIRSQLFCPSVQQINARLEGLLPRDAENLHWVEVTAESERLVLTLRDPHNALEAVRTIPLDASCDELARASAVAIAIWGAQAAKPSPPVIAAPPAAVAEPIFDAYALRAMRQQVLIASEPREPPSTSGAFLTLFLGTAIQVAGLGLGVSATWSAQGDARAAGAAALSVVGTGTLVAGLVWWLQQIATTPHEADL